MLNSLTSCLVSYTSVSYTHLSDIPFNGPISEVRVARIDGQFVINPTFEQLEKADMDLMVAATYENIMMVEGEMHEVSEAELLEAMKVAHEAIKIHCKAQMELTEEVGKTVKREYNHEVDVYKRQLMFFCLY